MKISEDNLRKMVRGEAARILREVDLSDVDVVAAINEGVSPELDERLYNVMTDFWEALLVNHTYSEASDVLREEVEAFIFHRADFGDL